MVWLLQHAQACVFSAGQLFRSPVNSLLTTAVIGIALSLPAGFYLVLDNSQRVVGGWDRSAEISLFLKTSTGPAEISRLLGFRVTEARMPPLEPLAEPPVDRLRTHLQQ